MDDILITWDYKIEDFKKFLNIPKEQDISQNIKTIDTDTQVNNMYFSIEILT